MRIYFGMLLVGDRVRLQDGRTGTVTSPRDMTARVVVTLQDGRAVFAYADSLERLA